MTRTKEKMTLSMSTEARTLIRSEAVRLRTTASALVEQWIVEHLEKSNHPKNSENTTVDCSLNFDETQLTE
jgi:hypothetical protein